MGDEDGLVDVTDLVEVGDPDDEGLPMTRCVCGQTFGHWDRNIYPEHTEPCPQCGRRFVYRCVVRVFEVRASAPAEGESNHG